MRFDLTSSVVSWSPRRARKLTLQTLAAFAVAWAVSLGMNTGQALSNPGGDEQTLFSLTNQDRTSNGVPSLAQNGTLFAIARNSPNSATCGFSMAGRSQDMMNRNYFAHYILNCKNPGTPTTNKLVFNIMQSDGISYLSAGENIGWTAGSESASPDNINNAFMNSPEHRANILNRNFNQAGMGVAGGTTSDTCCAGASTIMYTEIFRQVSTSAPKPPPPPPPPPPTSKPPSTQSSPKPPVLRTSPPPVVVPRNSPAPSPKAPAIIVKTPSEPSPSPSPSAKPTGGHGAEVRAQSSQGQSLIELVVNLVLKNLLNI